MSDDVLKRVEACLAGLDDESLNQHPYGLGLVRDLAAAVRDLRAWQAAAMANHKDFERSQRELHERAERAEATLAQLRAFWSDTEARSADAHAVYQAEAHRRGDVRHPDAYDDLSEPTKEWDRVLVRWVQSTLAAHPTPTEEKP